MVVQKICDWWVGHWCRWVKRTSCLYVTCTATERRVTLALSQTGDMATGWEQTGKYQVSVAGKYIPKYVSLSLQM